MPLRNHYHTLIVILVQLLGCYNLYYNFTYILDHWEQEKTPFEYAGLAHT